jgi:hydroxyacylglutathione hydrolase
MQRTPLVAALVLCCARTGAAGTLEDKIWHHGSADCSQDHAEPIEVFEFDPNTYILRQNKCVDFEAPFIYVLFGERMVFIQDTGATAEPAKLPIYATIRKLVEQHQPAGSEPLRWLVTHSHSHGDHKAGDAQFRGQPGVTLIEPTAQAVRSYFGFEHWPEGVARVELGARQLLVLPIPGHQDESLAVYDAQTGWLLTGDTVYPGRLYVFDWNAYRASVQRLAEFANTHQVTAVVGTHIEMSKRAGEDYPMGSTHQPDEAPLPVTVQDLRDLDAQLRQAGASSKKITLAKFIVTPISWFERTLSTIIGWFL